LPSKQAKSIEKGAAGKKSKVSYLLSIISFIFGISSIIFTLSLIFFVSSSIYIRYLPYTLYVLIQDPYYFLVSVFIYNSGFIYILDEGYRLLAHIFGILFSLLGISGFFLGIVSLGIRRRATHHEPDNVLIKRAYILAILGLILSIISAYFGALLFSIPFHPRKFYNVNFWELFFIPYIWRL